MPITEPGVRRAEIRRRSTGVSCNCRVVETNGSAVSYCRSMERLESELDSHRVDPGEARAVLERLRAAKEDERPTVTEFAEAAGASVEEVESALRAVRLAKQNQPQKRGLARPFAIGAVAILAAAIVLNVPITSSRPFHLDTSVERPLREDESFQGDGTHVEVEILYKPSTLWRYMVGANVQAADPAMIVPPDGIPPTGYNASDVVLKSLERLGTDRYRASFDVHYTGWKKLVIPWNVDGKRFETELYSDRARAGSL